MIQGMMNSQADTEFTFICLIKIYNYTKYKLSVLSLGSHVKGNGFSNDMSKSALGPLNARAKSFLAP